MLKNFNENSTRNQFLGRTSFDLKGTVHLKDTVLFSTTNARNWFLVKHENDPRLIAFHFVHFRQQGTNNYAIQARYLKYETVNMQKTKF